MWGSISLIHKIDLKKNVSKAELDWHKKTIAKMSDQKAGIAFALETR